MTGSHQHDAPLPEYGAHSVKPVPRRVSCTYAEAVYFMAALYQNRRNSMDIRTTVLAMLAAMYGRRAETVAEHLERGYV